MGPDACMSDPPWQENPHAHNLQSWYVAWISLTGTWLGMISCAMGVAVQVQSYVAVARDYEPKNWHAILVRISLVDCAASS